jgi:hypothetical protein
MANAPSSTSKSSEPARFGSFKIILIKRRVHDDGRGGCRSHGSLLSEQGPRGSQIKLQQMFSWLKLFVTAVRLARQFTHPANNSPAPSGSDHVQTKPLIKWFRACCPLTSNESLRRAQKHGQMATSAATTRGQPSKSNLRRSTPATAICDVETHCLKQGQLARRSNTCATTRLVGAAQKQAQSPST